MVPLDRALAAWLEHLRDLGVEGLRLPLPERLPVTTGPGAAAPGRRAPTPPPGPAQAEALEDAPARGSAGRVGITTPPPAAPAAADAARRDSAAAGLRAIREDIGDCRRCKLCQGRTHIVFGVGNPAADLMFVGEAPGADEDAQGEPFVGRAGQLLTKIIEAMGLGREDVYIANIIKCRPPENRTPAPREVVSCFPYLRRQIEIIAPDVISVLGNVAARSLLDTQAPISRIRGRWTEYQGIPVLPTFHPAYLLRNPADKRLAWDDLQKIMARLGLATPRGDAR